MARLQLNKSSLAAETKNLKIYQRFLPSLDPKRRQLMAERANADRVLVQVTQQIERFQALVGEKIPMLANLDVDLSELVKVTEVQLGTQNLVGTHLPYLDRIDIQVQPYALLAKPHWVDNVTSMLQEMIELQVSVQVFKRRLHLLTEATKIINQRINLFEKVLIPNTQSNIKRIKIYLSDGQMAAVVRSKIAKRRHSVERLR